MKAVICAAGNGVRMRPFTDNVPKPLLMVRGKTLLDHLVSQFPQEIDELIIVTRYLAEKIEKHCGAEFHSRKVVYMRQPEGMNGTFAAVKICESLIGQDEHFFVFYADDLMAKEPIAECLRHSSAIVAAEVQDPGRFGVLVVNTDGTLKGIMEKPEHPPTNLVLTNTMLLHADIFHENPPVHANGERYLTDALCAYAEKNPITIVKTSRWLPIGYPEDLQKADIFLSGIR